MTNFSLRNIKRKGVRKNTGGETFCRYWIVLDESYFTCYLPLDA